MTDFRTIKLPNKYLYEDIIFAFNILNNAGIETNLEKEAIILNFDVVDMKYLETQNNNANELIVNTLNELLKIRSFSTSNGKTVFKSFNKDKKVTGKKENKQKRLGYEAFKKEFSEENNNAPLKYSWEFIEIFCKNSLKKDGDKNNIDITGDEFKKWVYGKWSIAPERKMKEYGHDAMFPEELARRAIKLFSYKNDIVLDPFNGAGTTTKVAYELERQFIGIDIDPKYCEIAEKRLKESRFLFESNIT